MAIATASNYQTILDDIMVHEAVTGWMEANAGRVKYNGGKKVYVPKLALDGLGTYEDGFYEGSINFEYEERSLSQDRGREFSMDEMAVDETNFALTASTVMAEFQRTKVIPEIDAYRISKLASVAITAENARYGYTPSSQQTFTELKEAISKVRDNGFTGELVCHIGYEALNDLELYLTGRLPEVRFKAGGVDTTFKSVDDVPLIPTPKDRMYTAITLRDGKTSGQTMGGYTKASTGLDINFIVIAKNVPIAISKQDKPRIFDPETNQKKRAWQIDYRRYHDLWVLDNAVGGIFVNIKDAEP